MTLIPEEEVSSCACPIQEITAGLGGGTLFGFMTFFVDTGLYWIGFRVLTRDAFERHWRPATDKFALQLSTGGIFRNRTQE